MQSEPLTLTTVCQTDRATTGNQFEAGCSLGESRNVFTVISERRKGGGQARALGAGEKCATFLAFQQQRHKNTKKNNNKKCKTGYR